MIEIRKKEKMNIADEIDLVNLLCEIAKKHPGTSQLWVDISTASGSVDDMCKSVAWGINSIATFDLEFLKSQYLESGLDELENKSDDDLIEYLIWFTAGNEYMMEILKDEG